MSQLLGSFKAESIKLKHTVSLWVYVLIPVIGGALFAMYFIMYMSRTDISKRLELILSAVSLLLPLLVSALCCLSVLQEEYNSFQALLTGIKKTKNILAKILLFVSLELFSLLLFFMFIIIAGIFTGELNTEVIKMLLLCCIYFVCSSIFMYLEHLFLSLKLGIGASVIIGIVECLGVILFSNISLEAMKLKWDMIPWAWSIGFIRSTILQYEQGNLGLLGTQIIHSLVITLLVLIVFGIWFKNWEGRGKNDD